MQEIPLNGRHFLDMGFLIPGTLTPPQNANLAAPLRGQGFFGFNTAGGREDTINFMVNGINLNDFGGGNQITFQPTIGTIDEFKVDNSTFSAEYGFKSGAIVNMATRSGDQSVARRNVRVLPQPRFGRAKFRQSSRAAAGGLSSQPVWRRWRRADQEGQNVFLPEL